MTTLTKLQPAPVIDEIARLLTEHYVFPEIAEQLAGLLQRRLAEGAYDVDGAEELARLVTADLQSANDDRHLRLKHHADPVPSQQGQPPWPPCAGTSTPRWAVRPGWSCSAEGSPWWSWRRCCFRSSGPPNR
ncbi:hypothetical protein Prum_092160 [Phytohabitans rumicis]|uniref:Uncharacterized protein n=1 Tax=Phytohabitans rumicis TaxID=1076125 RepID=A0A6V8LH54_9ACTN|nr:hypothetical protein Prum_092160 [Phytohabitans rumicis]